MRTKIRTTILTTNQTLSWLSVDEVLPLIVRSWQATECEGHSVSVLAVDRTNLTRILKKAIESDNIVFSCYTPKIYKLARVLRFEMRLNVRFIVHLFNHSTIACWPMRFYGGENLFRKSDLFITTCRNDRNCLKISYPDARVSIIPFPLVRSLTPARAKQIQKIIPFIYFGRLSSQKQVHLLLFSFFLLKKKYPNLSWTLKLIGKEDHLGSPNMGLPETRYLGRLKQLVRKLKITQHVEFLGFKSREQINKILSKNKHIFTSASLHSDENYGNSAFQALAKGHLAVLSNWGGHSDFKIHFGKQVFLCPVSKTLNGPVIQASQFCFHLVSASKKYANEVGSEIPRYYDSKKISFAKRKLAMSGISNRGELPASTVANLILKRARASIRRKANSKKRFSIFKGYNDPVALKFFSAYGMKNSLEEKLFKSAILQPWIVVDRQSIYIYDDHKGYRYMKKKSIQNKSGSILETYDGQKVLLNISDLTWLRSRGYIEIF
jgi:glycosyltransferase involved in cell wall biosynthesis